MKGLPLSCMLALWLGFACTGCPDSERAPRNLVLISLDTVGSEHTSLYGYERDTTPNLEALAQDGVVFANAYSTSPWTLPSHASLLTGLYPTSLAPDPTDRRLYAAAPLLSEMFAKKGYRTAAITGGGFVSAEHGADRGFESFREGGGVAAALDWIAKHADEPFFFFFHTYAAHTPYRDRRYTDGLDPGRLAGLYTPGRPKKERTRLHNQIVYGTAEFEESEKQYVRGLYDGGIARADAMVGELARGLERLGLADSTVVVVTSDHGEEFWQHTNRGAVHGHTLHAELLRIPLVWHEPGLPARGIIVDEPVSLVDVTPTIVARFGLATPAKVDGEDLSPLLQGGSWNVERFLFAEGPRFGTQRAAVIGRSGKLIEVVDRTHRERAPTHELYLPDDPEETHDRADDASPVREELGAALAAHRANAAPPAPTGTGPELRPETRKRLRELGYVE